MILTHFNPYGKIVTGHNQGLSKKQPVFHCPKLFSDPGCWCAKIFKILYFHHNCIQVGKTTLVKHLASSSSSFAEEHSPHEASSICEVELDGARTKVDKYYTFFVIYQNYFLCVFHPGIQEFVGLGNVKLGFLVELVLSIG